jgi:hypothetical protein
VSSEAKQEVLKRASKMPKLTTFLGQSMVQAVSHLPLTAETWIQARVTPCGICGGQSGTGTGFAPSSSIFPSVSIYHGCP